MRRGWIAGLGLVALWSCAPAPHADNELVVSGVRSQLQTKLATTPYEAPDAEICEIATAVLVRAGAGAEPERIDPMVGTVDCGASFVAAGFDLSPAVQSPTFRRIGRPGRLADGMLLVGLDYGCTPSMCLGGTSYVMARDNGAWVVRDEAVVWMR